MSLDLLVIIFSTILTFSYLLVPFALIIAKFYFKDLASIKKFCIINSATVYFFITTIHFFLRDTKPANINAAYFWGGIAYVILKNRQYPYDLKAFISNYRNDTSLCQHNEEASLSTKFTYFIKVISVAFITFIASLLVFLALSLTFNKLFLMIESSTSFIGKFTDVLIFPAVSLPCFISFFAAYTVFFVLREKMFPEEIHRVFRNTGLFSLLIAGNFFQLCCVVPKMQSLIVASITYIFLSLFIFLIGFCRKLEL